MIEQPNTQIQAAGEDGANAPDWTKLAREAYGSSTTYFDASIRRQVEGDLRQFQGQHPHNSKYLADSGKARSKLFRPKTRTAVRKNEAIAAEAFFSTVDAVSVSAQDDNDPQQLASAAVMQQLLQFRLTKSIPWFQTVLGAYQDALTVGTVISYQYWEYDERKKIDRPCIHLVPLENFRYDPGASWTDPVGTSPYLIELLPMYVKDVKKRMAIPDGKTGEAPWQHLPDAKILTAIKQYGDSIRLQREGQRTDPKDQQQAVSDFSVVWVHRNVIEVDGQDYLYYTLGCEELLSEPVPLEQAHPHGRRPYVVGNCVIETHKNYPSSPTRLSKDVQAEINDVANLRIDNLRLAMNKRYLVKRNKQVDLRSLTRNVPGSVTLVTDTEADVKPLEFTDVTASSYKEQEVLNLDFDDVTGTFSGSSVQSNRKLNETVGGMELLNTGANQVAGYQLKTFVETWVEPVLRQLVLLEQYYETDDTLMALAGQKAAIFEKFGIDQVTDELLLQELTLTVNVGMGATNPADQVTKFMQAMNALRELLADGVLLNYGLRVEEVVRELFGKLGYRDGGRFFDTANDDPTVKALKAMVQQLQQQLEAKQPQALIDAQVRKLEAEITSLSAKDKDVQASAVKKGVESAFSAMQAGELLAAVPQIAPLADAIMQGSGYQQPVPPGVDPNYPQPAGQGVQTVKPVSDPRTGVGFTPGAPGALQQPGPAAPLPETQPNTPGVGVEQGIRTLRADSAGVHPPPGMSAGGMVRGYANGGVIDPEQQRLEQDNRRMYPEAYGARAEMGMTVNGLTDRSNMELGINPQTLDPMTRGQRAAFQQQELLTRSHFGPADSDYGYADGGVIDPYQDQANRDALKGVLPAGAVDGMQRAADWARGVSPPPPPPPPVRLGDDKSFIGGVVDTFRHGITQARKELGFANGGMIEPGNIDLERRPTVRNPDGSVSTVRSMSFGDQRGHVLIPTVARDGSRILSDHEAVAQHYQTGEHLGIFDSPENATGYAQSLHQQQSQQFPGIGRPNDLRGGMANGGSVGGRFGGGRFGDAAGVIQGPGTGTSDSVPAVNTDTGKPLAVSSGEVIIPEDVVQALGADFFLKLIEQFHHPVNPQQ